MCVSIVPVIFNGQRAKRRVDPPTHIICPHHIPEGRDGGGGGALDDKEEEEGAENEGPPALPLHDGAELCEGPAHHG